MDDASGALAYHERSKHHLHRYARSPGGIDWATQPDPFRRFVGAPELALPLCADALAVRYAELFEPGALPPRRFDRDAVATLFELALGLSAWKEFRGSRWALRVNPSSGNLHPTEGYAILPPSPGLPAGVYHYAAREHLLERRCTLDSGQASALARLLPPGGLLVGLTSIAWREAWKYGERAFRYCQHDLGHALATVRFAAAALGWRAVLCEGFGDDALAALVGLDRVEDFAYVAEAERERPEAAVLVCPATVDADLAAAALCGSAADAVAIVRAGAWTGTAKALSPAHVVWKAIDEAAEATHKSPTAQPRRPAAPPGTRRRIPGDAPASGIIRNRRSAVDLDGRTAIDAATLYAMLDHLIPRAATPPWDVLPWAPQVHLGMFVHRVRGLFPGLYAFERDGRVHERLRSECRASFAWEPPPGCPDGLGLYLLRDGDVREAAQIVSCHQEIAADGAFSLGMIAELGASVRARGGAWYRRLHWESGVLGQMLYLDATAAQDPGGPLQATGIGCFFDDAFHEVLGIEGDAFQTLYHFTVGAPVEDPRLTTLPPYAHLEPHRRPSR